MREYENYEEMFQNESPETLLSMLEQGQDVYGKYRENYYGAVTFFEAAIRWGTPNLVRACIGKGADPERLEPEGRRGRPLEAAISAHNVETLQALIEAGANVQTLHSDEGPRDEYHLGLMWNMQKDFLPEMGHLDTFDEREKQKILAISQRIKIGVEILTILYDAGLRISGIGEDCAGLSLYSLKNYSTVAREENIEREPFGVHRDPFFENALDIDDYRACRPLFGTRPGALWHAVSPDALRGMVAGGADVNMVNAQGWNTLHYLAWYYASGYYHNPSAMMQNLIEAGVDVNSRGYQGETPLMLALEQVGEHPVIIEAVKLLMKNGADIRLRDEDYGFSTREYLYDYSCRKSYANVTLHEFAYRFLETPLPTGTNEDLLTAAAWGEPGDLASILERGANINAKTQRGFTPLMFAAAYNPNMDSLTFLLEHGADINAQNEEGRTPLMIALALEAVQAAYLLIERGADVTLMDNEDKYALDILIYKDSKTDNFSRHQFGLVKAIVEAGMDLSDYHLPVRWSGDIVDYLIQHGASAKPRSATALISAARYSQPEEMKRLIDMGIDVNIQDDEGKTALIEAVRGKNVDTVALLLDAGADVNATDNAGRTALSYCLTSKQDNSAILNFLLKAGADKNMLKSQQIINKKMERQQNFIECPLNQYIPYQLGEFGLYPGNSFKELFEVNGEEALVKAIREFPSMLFEEIEEPGYSSPYWHKTKINIFLASLYYGWKGIQEICLGEQGERIEGMLGDAVLEYNVELVRLLLDLGVCGKKLEQYEWRLRANVFPEGEQDTSERARELKGKLDAGAKILHLLRKSGVNIHDYDSMGRELTYVWGQSENNSSFMQHPESLSDEPDPYSSPDQVFHDNSLAWLRHSASPMALKEALDAGANVNDRDKDGASALHFILEYRHEYFNSSKMVKMLIDAGADLNAVAWYNKWDIDAEYQNGITPLELIFMGGDMKLIKTLIVSGKAPKKPSTHGRKKDRPWGKSREKYWDNHRNEAWSWPLKFRYESEWFVEGYWKYRAESMLKNDLLLTIDRVFSTQKGRRGKRSRRLRRKGNPFIRELDVDLMIAVYHGKTDEIIQLLKAGANVNARSLYGHTPLMFAASNNRPRTVTLLLEAGATAGARDFLGNNALHFSCLSGHPNAEVFQILMNAGLDINKGNNDGYTPLMMVSANCFEPRSPAFSKFDERQEDSPALMLIQVGADVNAHRPDGTCALSLALKREHFRTVQTLIDAGADVMLLLKATENNEKR